MIRRLSLMALAIGLAAAAPAQVTGPARVVDGDTFSVGAERVRLWGVDAPEGRQVCQNDQGKAYACGDVARDQLVGLIGRRAVRCEVRDRDPYGRAVAQCLAGSTDLGEAMVRAGWAVDFVQFSRGAYWCTRAGEKLHPNVVELAKTLGPNFEHLEIKGFDEAVSDLREMLRDEDLYKGRGAPDAATGHEPFADRPANQASIENLDLDLALATLQTYCNNLGRSPVTRDTLLPLLRDLRLTAMDNGVERPTNGCILLFATNLKRWFPHAVVSGSIDGKKRSVFEGNLLIQRRDLLAWLETADINPTLKVKKISVHAEEPTYSRRALVELLINMLVHRDYERVEPSIVRLTPGKEIEFRNPGALSDEARKRVEFDKEGHFLQVPVGHARNSSLCDIFAGIRAMEWRGTGLPDVVKLAQAAGGEAFFSIDPKNEFLARMTQRPSSSGVAPG